jgi:hypothetical protein
MHRVIAAAEAETTLLQRKEAARLSPGGLAQHAGPDGADSEQGRPNAEGTLLELAASFARGDIGKEEYLAAKASLAPALGPPPARATVSREAHPSLVDPARLRIGIAVDEEQAQIRDPGLAPGVATVGGSHGLGGSASQRAWQAQGAAALPAAASTGTGRHLRGAGEAERGPRTGGGLLSDRREFGGRSGAPAAEGMAVAAASARHGGGFWRLDAEDAAAQTKSVTFAAGVARQGEESAVGGAAALRGGGSAVREDDADGRPPPRVVGGRLGALGGSGRWHGGYRAGEGVKRGRAEAEANQAVRKAQGGGSRNVRWDHDGTAGGAEAEVAMTSGSGSAKRIVDKDQHRKTPSKQSKRSA